LGVVTVDATAPLDLDFDVEVFGSNRSSLAVAVSGVARDEESRVASCSARLDGTSAVEWTLLAIDGDQELTGQVTPIDWSQESHTVNVSVSCRNGAGLDSAWTHVASVNASLFVESLPTAILSSPVLTQVDSVTVSWRAAQLGFQRPISYAATIAVRDDQGERVYHAT
jgi:hypothetical protein